MYVGIPAGSRVSLQCHATALSPSQELMSQDRQGAAPSHSGAWSEGR